jgi:hypothetical protein
MEKASRLMLRGDPDESWMLDLTGLNDAGAPCGKSAAAPQACLPTRLARKLEQARLVAFERPGRIQETCRIGVLGIIKDCRGRTDLDNLTRIHDRNPIAQIPGDRKIMGDKQDRYSKPTLMMPDQIKNLALNQVIEISCRLVGDNELRPQRQHHANEHPLQHAATQLMRIGVNDAIGCTDAHLSEQMMRIDLPWLFRSRAAGSATGDGVSEMPAYGLRWVERTYRVLKDHRQLAATKRRELGIGHPGEFMLTEPDEFRFHLGVLWKKPQDREAGDGLAGP